MICKLCECEVGDETTGHHFIPRTTHRRRKIKRQFKKKQLDQKEPMCNECHYQIHHLIPDEFEMALEYNTLDKLKSHEKVSKWIEFIRKKRKID